MDELVHNIALCIIAAWVFGFIAKALHQPVILAYLLAGFALGPSGFGLVHEQESISTIAELGLIFLLFMIGLEIDLKKIMGSGRPILITGISQILGGCVLGVLFFWLIGFPLSNGRFDALYLGIAAALSSTVIIVKILYDKHELDTLPGRITLGLLVLQDLFVILFLAIQPTLDNLQFSAIGLSFLKVAVLVAGTFTASRFLLPPIFHLVARVPELVLVGAIAWCFLVGGFAEWLGLSVEMGALVAGVSLSTFPYALDVTAKVTSLRDFFVILFFVGLGMIIPLPTVSLALWAVVFAAFVIASRWVTTFFPLYFLRQGLRTSLLPSINLCQISEFSLVLLALGLGSNQLSAESSSMVTFAFVLLATLSTFAMTKSGSLVRAIIPFAKRCGIHDLDRPGMSSSDSVGHGSARIVFLGFFRTASSLLEELSRKNSPLLEDIAVLDFNPVVHRTLKSRGIQAIYGDMSQRDTLRHAGIGHAQVILSTLPDAILKGTSNARLVREARELNPSALIVATAENFPQVSELYAAGANFVSIGRLAEANALCQVLEAAESGLLEEKRAELDALLENRNEVLS
jgi:Kef-type K+ transport system membrane component KefB